MLTFLTNQIKQRVNASSEESWTATLLTKGPPYIARKVGEEAVEVVVAAVEDKQSEVISESADLLYHLAVLWHAMGISPEDVEAELRKREGVSGLAEKASRPKE